MTKRCLILCQNPALAASLHLWLTRSKAVDEERVAAKAVGQAPSPEQISQAFDELADWLEPQLTAAASYNGVSEILVITDLCGYSSFTPADFNPISPNGWKTVLGMLILGFPEIHWVFSGGVYCDQSEGSKIQKEIHCATQPANLQTILTSVPAQKLSPLFDGSGLRNAIRQTITDPEKRPLLPNRTCLAIAIDEEHSYSWLHAYTAYRFGFRAFPVTTFAGMKCVLNDPFPLPLLIFEDYYLQFSDGNPAKFSLLRNRDKESDEGEKEKKTFAKLTQADYRILVTSGHHRGQNEDTRLDNLIYRRELRNGGQWNRELNKPLGGIFDLWRHSGLQRKLRGGGRRGLAPDFVWPPKDLPESESGHSAPGRLLVIADRLIARAERLLLSEVQSVPQAVHGALLATDALELLAGKTPTTSLEALSVKHHCEVLAECQFEGLQQHMEVKDRTKDIRLEVKAICQWFGANKRRRQAAAWNAELSMLNRLIDIFRLHNQFDEEMLLQVRARQLHRKLRFVKYPAFKPLEIFPWYVEKLVASFPWFIAAIIFWIVFLGRLYSDVFDVSWSHGMVDVFVAFFSFSPPPDKEWNADNGLSIPVGLVAFTILLGFTHLGILVSYLYSLISRK